MTAINLEVDNKTKSTDRSYQTSYIAFFTYRDNSTP